MPDTLDFLVPRALEGDVKSETTYTAESASYVEAGFDKQQASASFPFAAASSESIRRGRPGIRAQETAGDRPLVFSACHVETPVLHGSINALPEGGGGGGRGGPVHRQDPRTSEGLRGDGTVVPGEILLGGQMTLTHTELSSSTVNEKEVEDTVAAAVSIKTSKVAGSVGAAFSNAKGEKVTAESLSKSIQFKVQGGDTTLTSNPVDWPGTVKKPTNWAVIGQGSWFRFSSGYLKRYAIGYWHSGPKWPCRRPSGSAWT